MKTLLTICTLCTLLGAVAGAQAAEPLKACVEDSDYPPFTYFKDDGKGVKLPVGQTVDYLNALSKALGQPITIQALPQLRCLNSLEQGEVTLGMDFFLDSTRTAKFDYSKPYFVLEPRYFYSRKRFPTGLPISGKADLRKYPGCGLRGYSYEHYGLNSGPMFDTGTSSHDAAFKKLLAGRCDFFVEEAEIIAGYNLTGQPGVGNNPDIGSAPIADVVKPTIHFLISRKHPDTQALRERIDAFISKTPMKMAR